MNRRLVGPILKHQHGFGSSFLPTRSSSLISKRLFHEASANYNDLGGYPSDVTTALSTLGIRDSSSANSETVKKKYKQLVAKFHPDVPGGSDAKMKSVNTAYDVIRKYEEQNGGTLKPSCGMSGYQQSFSDCDERAFREHVHRHPRAYHVRHDDEDAFETFHDFVFGGNLKPNFHTVEFKQRSAKRRKPTEYDEYKYFTSFEENVDEDKFFEEHDDYMNDFSDPMDYADSKNHRPPGKQGQNSRQGHRHKPGNTLFDEYENDANYQQREQYIDEDEVFYSPNRFYGMQSRHDRNFRGHGRGRGNNDRYNRGGNRHHKSDHYRNGRRRSHSMDGNSHDFT